MPTAAATLATATRATATSDLRTGSSERARSRSCFLKSRWPSASTLASDAGIPRRPARTISKGVAARTCVQRLQGGRYRDRFDRSCHPTMSRCAESLRGWQSRAVSRPRMISANLSSRPAASRPPRHPSPIPCDTLRLTAHSPLAPAALPLANERQLSALGWHIASWR